jgi:hypothetical protein
VLAIEVPRIDDRRIIQHITLLLTTDNSRHERWQERTMAGCGTYGVIYALSLIPFIKSTSQQVLLPFIDETLLREALGPHMKRLTEVESNKMHLLH